MWSAWETDLYTSGILRFLSAWDYDVFTLLHLLEYLEYFFFYCGQKDFTLYIMKFYFFSEMFHSGTRETFIFFVFYTQYFFKK